MSLVGNLEDLNLGDILQIISLSQKSGVLALASDHGSGRIVFRKGLVHGACLKGGPSDLRSLLAHGGFIDPGSEEAALVEEAGVTTEQTDRLIREVAEAAILEMFEWPAGDFSFDVRSQLDPEDPQLILAIGINAQYLAMEGLRQRDERTRAVGEDAIVDLDDLANPNLPNDPIFGSDLLETDADDLDGSMLESDLLLELELELEVDPSESHPELEGVLLQDAVATTPIVAVAPEAPSDAAEVLVARVIERAEAVDDPSEFAPAVEAAVAPVSMPPARDPDLEALSEPDSSIGASQVSVSSKKMPVVLIDPDVVVLEWVKSAIDDEFARVHVFQQADQGLARIRQYLIRGEIPLVLISSETQIDPLSGIHGLGDFVKRLKAQAPRLVVVGLRDEEDVASSPVPGSLDAVLRRPARWQMTERDQAALPIAAEAFVRNLFDILSPQGSTGGPGSDRVQSPEGPEIREATARLLQASSRAEVLPILLEVASEHFARVAILSVREDRVFAIVGSGIAALEVDPLDSAPPISLETQGAGWVRQVLESKKPLVGAPTTAADRELLECFGAEEPTQAYLAPIVSESSVVAMLYGDQAISGRAMPNTSALEGLLRLAGTVLDRAALERANWEANADNR